MTTTENNSGRLNGKVALITGGNSGIGFATAKLFVQQGAKVAITGRRQEALDKAASEIGGDIITILADSSDIDAGKQGIKKVVEAYGNIDILFLNAGVAKFSPISDITEEHFNEHFNINVKGPFFTVKEALPHLNDNAIIISNTSALGQKGVAGSGVYSATKAALRSLSRVLAQELAHRKIRTVSIAPGPVETPIYNKMGYSEEELVEVGEGMTKHVPLGRFGSPDELARTVLFVASDEASYINGVEIEVDGGFSQV